MSARLAILSLLLAATIQGQVCGGRRPIVIDTWNDAWAPETVLRDAEREAARILTGLCVEIAWRSCHPTRTLGQQPCTPCAGTIKLHILASRLSADQSKHAMG